MAFPVPSIHQYSTKEHMQQPKEFPDKALSLTIKVGDVPVDDLYIAVRPLLKFGSIIGICPYGGLWRSSSNVALSYRRSSFMGIINFIIIFLMGINVLMNTGGMCTKIMSGESSPIKLARALTPLMFYIVGMHAYVRFAFNAKQVLLLLSNWRSTFNVVTYTKEGKKPVRKARFWTALVLTSAIFENVVYHLRYDCSQMICKYFEEVEDPSKLSVLEEYYLKEHAANWCGLPYNPVITVLLFLVNKLTVVATNFADVTIISFAWILATKFGYFYEEVSRRMDDHSICWYQARKDFNGLVRLLQQTQSFLSPMIFASYTLVIELTSTQIHLAISTETGGTVLAKVYLVWSFLHLIVRFMLLSIICSRIPDRCQELLLLLQRCPTERYTAEVERLERLVTAPMGLGGLGCFRITKSFILSVLNVIFTCEIIFLQGGANASTQS